MTRPLQVQPTARQSVTNVNSPVENHSIMEREGEAGASKELTGKRREVDDAGYQMEKNANNCRRMTLNSPVSKAYDFYRYCHVFLILFDI